MKVSIAIGYHRVYWLTRAPDLSLVQDHLDKLRRTKRPSPSLHHMLADRLEAWLRNMNMSPTVNLTQPVFDPSWSLFNENSIQIASGSCYPQNALHDESTFSNTADTSRPPTALVQHQQQQTYDDSGFWNVYESPAVSWPSGLNRLFGNSVFHETTNGDNIQ